MLLARNDSSERLDVYDEGGRPVGRVTHPLDPRLFGVERGTVYLERPVPTLARLASQPAAA
ncbi:MAG: hypothetical protein ACRENB_17200 [Gemmatimonadales bacterium]